MGKLTLDKSLIDSFPGGGCWRARTADKGGHLHADELFAAKLCILLCFAGHFFSLPFLLYTALERLLPIR